MTKIQLLRVVFFFFSDCYNEVMNLSTPILICDHSEEFRGLLRDMLTKHGFFHVVEAASKEESLQSIKNLQKSFFTIIRDEFLNEEVIQLLIRDNAYVIMAQPEKTQTTLLAARLGVSRFISFPFSSQKLLEKINEIL